MNSTYANIFNTALILMEFCMLLIFVNSFFTSKKKGLLPIISFLLLSGASCVILYFWGEHPWLKLAVIPIFFSIWIFIFYETSYIRSLFPIFFWLAFLTLGDTAVLSLLSTFTEKTSRELMLDPDAYYFLCFSIKIVELFAMLIISTFVKSRFTHGYSSFLDWLRILAFPTATLVISVFLLRIYYSTSGVSLELTICNAIILLVDIVSVFLLSYLEQQQKVMSDNIILRRAMKTELDNVEAWKKAYGGQRKQTHDFQNQLFVIHGLIDQNAPPNEVKQYIESLQGAYISASTMVKTHRTAVDVILNQKFAIAENSNIKFSARLDDLTAFPLSDDALIIVLSNLIDNAIEACEKIGKTEDRFILLKMKMEENAGFLFIENSTAAPVIIHNNRIRSTKRNQIEHGYGLQNVASIMEKHGAIYQLNYNDSAHTFSFSAQISI